MGGFHWFSLKDYPHLKTVKTFAEKKLTYDFMGKPCRIVLRKYLYFLAPFQKSAKIIGKWKLLPALCLKDWFWFKLNSNDLFFIWIVLQIVVWFLCHRRFNIGFSNIVCIGSVTYEHSCGCPRYSTGR